MKKENIVEAMTTWWKGKMDDIHTILPGQIVSYSGHAERKAEIKIMVKPKTIHGKEMKINPIKDVPVIFPSTKNFNLLFPLEKGDGVLLLFSESPIGNFLNNSTDNPLEVDDLSKFDLTDCVAIPGLWSFKNLPDKPDNDDDFFLQFQDSKIQIADSTNYITIEDKAGNIIETTSTSVKINGNLEVTQ